MAKKKTPAAKKKKAAKSRWPRKKPKIRGYEIIAEQKIGIIQPGEILDVEVPCPKGKVILGGGAHCQDYVGSATNYVLRSSYPVEMTDGTKKWIAVWTNTYSSVKPQVLQFTAYLICADA